MDVRGGVPVDSIVEGATKQDCDLIVMGTHGRRGCLVAVRQHSRSGPPAGALPGSHVKSPKFEPGHHRILPQTVE